MRGYNLWVILEWSHQIESLVVIFQLNSNSSDGGEDHSKWWWAEKKPKINLLTKLPCNLPVDIPVQFSHSVMSDSLWPHELQHTRPPCPSSTSGVHPSPCSSSHWCHPTISSSVVPFSSCPQSFPASVSFQMSQLFAWGGQSIGVSASASVPPMNTQDWPL